MCFLLYISVLIFSQERQGFASAQRDVGSKHHPLRLCAVLHSPDNYTGKTITIFATFRSGFEANELYCMGCEKQHVWAILSDDYGEYTEGGKKISRIDKENSGGVTMNGIFTGLLEGPGQFGHQGVYKYQLKVQGASSLKLVDRLGFVPDRLPPESRKRVCHDVTEQVP